MQRDPLLIILKKIRYNYPLFLKKPPFFLLAPNGLTRGVKGSKLTFQNVGKSP